MTDTPCDAVSLHGVWPAIALALAKVGGRGAGRKGSLDCPGRARRGQATTVTGARLDGRKGRGPESRSAQLKNRIVSMSNENEDNERFGSFGSRRCASRPAPAASRTLRGAGQRGFDPFEPLINLPKLFRRRSVGSGGRVLQL